MNKITKAVIPAAGLGTRLLPATKAVPKELLPIINTPVLQHIVQEAADSGIKEILIIISKDKKVICRHFSPNVKLNTKLIVKGKWSLLKAVANISKKVRIKYAFQKKQRGLGDAIGIARGFAHGHPVAVLLGDDVIHNSGKAALEQCMDAYYQTGCSIVGVQPVDMSDVSNYGVVSPRYKSDTKNKVFPINGLVEKPEVDEAPSNLAISGRYILTPDIYDAIVKTRKDKSREIQITNALKFLAENGRVCACNFTGTRYDLGSRLGMVKATIDFALRDPSLRKKVLDFIKEKE